MGQHIKEILCVMIIAAVICFVVYVTIPPEQSASISAEKSINSGVAIAGGKPLVVAQGEHVKMTPITRMRDQLLLAVLVGHASQNKCMTTMPLKRSLEVSQWILDKYLGREEFLLDGFIIDIETTAQQYCDTNQ